MRGRDVRGVGTAETDPGRLAPGFGLARIHRFPSLFGLVVVAFVVGGCTSLPFTPRSGPGAALTLVTVDHVEERERALRQELSAAIADEVAETVRAARESDREQLDRFADRMEAHTAELESLAARLEQNAATTLDLARVVKQRLDALVSESASIRDQARRLEVEIGGLPFETLDRLRRAIGDHLDAQVAEDGTAGRQEAPARAPGEASSS